MSYNIDKTNQFWSEYTEKTRGMDFSLLWWTLVPEIRRHINNKISGNPEIDWIGYTLNQYYKNELPLDRCLSLGCGKGWLERGLAQYSAFEQCDAYDISEGALKYARELAKNKGFDNINYYVADINKISLPSGMYDSIWISNSLHHIEALEHVCKQISKSLKRGGLFVLNDYVGPSRFQFSKRQKEIIDLCLKLLPVQYRNVKKEHLANRPDITNFKKGGKWFISRFIDKVRDGDLIAAIHRRYLKSRTKARKQNTVKTTINFPSTRDVMAGDPSEAIRSEEIIKVIRQYFEIVEKNDWGGNVLQFLLPEILGNFSTDDQQSQSLLKMLITIEDSLLQCGEFVSDFTYLVARPKLK